MEWKLFDTEPPEVPQQLAVRAWMELEGQPGFRQRAAMVAGLVSLIADLRPDIQTVTDLGCGDGAMMTRYPAHLKVWGYELGGGDVAKARERGLDVRCADILGADEAHLPPSFRHGLEYGDLVVASEVLEHLEDPRAFLKALPDRLLVVSSPSLETGDWHNAIHAWAWDMSGYKALLESAGWRVLYQADCDGGQNVFNHVPGPQRFQAVICAQADSL